MKRFLASIFLLFVLSSVNSLEITGEAGVSFFRYAEVSPNNKDDLYSMKSGLFGLNFNIPVGSFDVGLSAAAQLPWEMTFTDALGTDDYNYTDNFFYYGLNSRLSIGYDFRESDKAALGGNIFINFDYFYFQDNFVEVGTEYIFSVLGAGPALYFNYIFSDNFGIGLDAGYALNFLPLYSRTGDFLWSDNIQLTLSIIWSTGG